MIGVGKQELGAECFEILVRKSFYRAERAHGHKDRSFDFAVRSNKAPGAGVAVTSFDVEVEHDVILFADLPNCSFDHLKQSSPRLIRLAAWRDLKPPQTARHRRIACRAAIFDFCDMNFREGGGGQWGWWGRWRHGGGVRPAYSGDCQ